MSLTAKLNAMLVPEECGSVVHWLLLNRGYRVELDQRGRVRTTPRLDRADQLHPFLYELGTYAALRCERCGVRAPREGLRLAYWNAWLCPACCQELGAINGPLDRDGWPAAERRAA